MSRPNQPHIPTQEQVEKLKRRGATDKTIAAFVENARILDRLLEIAYLRNQTTQKIRILIGSQEKYVTYEELDAEIGQLIEIKSSFFLNDIQDVNAFYEKMEIAVAKTPLPTASAQLPIVEGDSSDERATLKEKCRKECENRKLPREVTVPRQLKFEIAQAIGLESLVIYKKFKPGEKSYHRISRILSELKYSQKKASRI
jgi:hypothetical protein